MWPEFGYSNIFKREVFKSDNFNESIFETVYLSHTIRVCSLSLHFVPILLKIRSVLFVFFVCFLSNLT